MYNIFYVNASLLFYNLINTTVFGLVKELAGCKAFREEAI